LDDNDKGFAQVNSAKGQQCFKAKVVVSLSIQESNCQKAKYGQTQFFREKQKP
jgi:hypothetical protein